MPELPEVTTIVGELASVLKNKKIMHIEVLDKKIFQENPEYVEGLKFKSVSRRAKLIIIELEQQKNIIIHLKLSGQLFYLPKETDQTITGEKIGKFARVVISFSDSSRLFFNDFRRFAYMKIVTNKELEQALAKYGPEPLEKDFTLEKFKAILAKKPKSKIKSLLLDQAAIAGIGNIYSDEILWLAKIHPLRKVNALTSNESAVLHKAIRQILIEAIEHKGTSGRDEQYRQITGELGKYAPRLKVYHRTGQKCLRSDGGIIKKVKIGGRSSHFCPVCQV